MGYIKLKPNPNGAYGGPQSNKVPGLLELPNSLLPDFLAYNGFVTLTTDGDTITAVTPNTEAWEAWKATIPEPAPPEPTELELAQQVITDLELNDIEQGQQLTDLELMFLGGEVNV